jgi:aryl-alcohol dehydrogenase
MQVTAAVMRAINSPLVIEKLELADPRPDEVLIRVVATGVCHTDIALTHGHPVPLPQPFVLGHEGAGVIERVGAAVSDLSPGDHVVMSFGHCGACANCQDGAPSYCDRFLVNFSGSRPDGSATLSHSGEKVFGNFFGQSSFATHALALRSNVVKVTQDVALELLGPLACGIQTGAGAVINALQVGVGASIAIFGAGAVGLSALMAARVVGATKIVVLDLHAERLDLAKELGATHVLNAGSGEVSRELAQLSPGGFNFSLDASGAPPALAAAMSCTATRGVCGIVGGGPPVMLNTPHLMTGGRTIRGIGIGDAVPALFIPQLIELHLQGRFPFDRLVRFYSLDQINTAFADSQSGKTVKPIIRM